MKVLLMIGSHPRHRHVAERLQEAGYLSAIVMEKREEFMPAPPAGIAEEDKALFIRHFEDRESAELKAFGTKEQEWGVPVLHTTTPQLNSDTVKQWVVDHQPDVVISFGVHKIDQHVLEVFPKYAWNIHGGLSPWYRGNTTLFWPFYFLKPNWAGMTIHRLTARLDAGGIVHHSVPELHAGEGIHDVAANAVKQAAEDLIHILGKVKQGEEIVEVPQKSSGKLFTSSDWHPHHLRVIYRLFDNDIVDRYLSGELGHSEPPLVKAF